MDIFSGLGYFIKLQCSTKSASAGDRIVVYRRIRVCTVESAARLIALARRRPYVFWHRDTDYSFLIITFYSGKWKDNLVMRVFSISISAA